MQHINKLYDDYVRCGGNMTLQDIYKSCTDSFISDPDKWPENPNLEEATENLLRSLVYIRCTPYNKIMELAEESQINKDKYDQLSPDVKKTIQSLKDRHRLDKGFDNDE